MKKHILILSVLFFSVVTPMDKPAENRKLLFPFPGKTAKDVWQMVREDYIAHRYFLKSQLFKSLPREIRQEIQRLWFMVHNPASFSTHEDQFFRKMLTACIRLSCREKEWKFNFLTRATADGRYYVYNETPKSDKIKIYDRASKKTIELSFDCRQHQVRILAWKLLINKSVIIFIRDAELLFYDIAKDKEYFYKDIFSLSCNDRFWISENERYVCVRDEDSYCVLDVTNLDDIKRYPFDVGALDIKNVTFSSDDNYFAAILNNQSVGLWTINDNGLTKQSCCDAGLWQCTDMYFTHNNEYVIGSCSFINLKCVQTIKVEKNESRSITDVSLRPSFCPDYYLWGIFKDVFIAHDETENLMIVDGAGKVLHTFQEKRPHCNADPSRKYIFQRSSEDQNKIIISRLLHDENGYYCGIQQDTIVSSSMGTSTNKQATIRRSVEVTHDVYTDLNGRLFGSMHGRSHSEFTSHGNAVIREKKKLILHPKGADDHFEKLAHKPLTLAHYASLEKICSEVEKLQ